MWGKVNLFCLAWYKKFAIAWVANIFHIFILIAFECVQQDMFPSGNLMLTFIEYILNNNNTNQY